LKTVSTTYNSYTPPPLDYSLPIPPLVSKKARKTSFLTIEAMTVQSFTSMSSAPLESSTITEDQLAAINVQLSTLSPQEILQWGVNHLPNLYQTTAFGLTGLVGIDMLSKIASSTDPATTSRTPPLIFLDTLYHFQETLDLVEKVKERYDLPVHVYKPFGVDNVKAFEETYGELLWEVSEEVYDYVVKVS
jgi:phosphoadenosine phosphosulfate reductase